MDKYLTIEQAADYLQVSEDTIKRYVEEGKLPFYKLDRALRFLFEDLDAIMSRNREILLTKGLRAAITNAHQLQEGVGAWRIILQFVDTTDMDRRVHTFGTNNRHFEYDVEVTEEYLEDIEHLSANVSNAEKFALKYIKDRFDETRDKNGDRSIRRINENVVWCAAGRCRRGKRMPLPVIRN